MLMGESDESVAPLLEQADFVRGYVPEDVSFRACLIPSAYQVLVSQFLVVVVVVIASVFFSSRIPRRGNHMEYL